MTSVQRKKLMNNVALITGASRGIGKAVAAAYLREGARVFICARNQQEVAATVRELRDDITDAQVTSAKRPMFARSSMPPLRDFKPLTPSSTMQACSGRGWLSLSTRLGNGKRSSASTCTVYFFYPSRRSNG
jgi:hypothetical protein